MSMDYSGRRPETSVTDAEGVMFAAEPVWDRASRKRRGLGGRRNARAAEVAPAATATVAEEPRSFAADPMDAPMDLRRAEPMAGDRPVADIYDTTPSTLAAERDTYDTDTAGEPSLFTPIGRATTTRTTRAKAAGGAAPAAIAAGAIAVVALGATGWWMTRDATGVPELTPGATESQVAVAPLTPAPAPVAPPEMAVNPPAAPPAAAPERLASAAPVRAERRTPTVRTRPAAAASAETAAVNASTTLPDGPQPYSSLNPSATPAPVNPPTLAIPPAAAEPIPSTPPVAPDPAPTATDATPATPDTTTPPQ